MNNTIAEQTKTRRQTNWLRESPPCANVDVALRSARELMKKCPNGPRDVHSMSELELQSACGRCNFYKTKVSFYSLSIFHGLGISRYPSQILHTSGQIHPRVYRTAVVDA